MNRPRIITLDALRVIAIWLVMCIHSPVVSDMQATPGIWFIKDFIACGAVPVFFILSGWLGAARLNSEAVGARAFFAEKFRTLAVPYLFWNALVLALVLTAKAAGMDSLVRGGGAYFNVEFHPSSLLAALLGIGRPPIVYQFWFLRDLILAVIAAFAICRFLPRIPLLPWLLFLLPHPLAPSLGYYLLGHQLASAVTPEQFPRARGAVLYAAGWALIGTGLMSGFLSVPHPLLPLGSAAFIFMVALIAGRLGGARPLAALAPAVFFVYATHEPLQTLLGRVWEKLQWPGYGTFICFLAVPAIVFPVCTTAFWLLKTWTPKLASLMTGGR